jgi:hypothetical protein
LVLIHRAKNAIGLNRPKYRHVRHEPRWQVVNAKKDNDLCDRPRDVINRCVSPGVTGCHRLPEIVIVQFGQLALLVGPAAVVAQRRSGFPARRFTRGHKVSGWKA